MADNETQSSLPACQRCKIGKKRCDRQGPKCSVCAKASTACIIVDPISGKQYTRGYIHDLEVKERALAAGNHQGTPSSAVREPRDDATEPGHNETPRDAPTTASIATSGGFVGDGSGVSFLRTAFAGSGWDSQYIQAGRKAPERPQLPESSLTPNAAPSYEEASSLVENYFAHFHVHHTFMIRRDVQSTFMRVYQSAASDTCTAQDYFRLFMVFAVSGVSRYRSGQSVEHPFGYYLSALAHIESVPLIGSADAIQNLLLISRFGMYHHIGVSLWDIAHFCMRQCVELGYHTSAPAGTAALDDQKSRRIFWECYVLDRYSSGILGRPFAIADDDITTALPVDANDEEIEITSAASLPPPLAASFSELTVCILLIKLRRITSQVYSEFYTGRKHGSRSGTATPSPPITAGHVQIKLQQFLDELQRWRNEAPVYAFPRSLYERPEWHDFMMEKDKLILIRGAMHLAPKRRNGTPSIVHLDLCYETAAKVITLYADMQQRKQITWTRSYFQVIFTAGLCVIYCLSLRTEAEKQTSLNHVAVLDRCSQILEAFKLDMPDAGSFAVVFRQLKQDLLRQRPPATSHDHSASVVGGAAFDLDATNAMSQQHQPGQALFPMNNNPSTDLHTDFALDGFDIPDLHQEPLDWLMNEGTLENIEAGLGEYAWGFPDLNAGWYNTFDTGNMG